MKWNRSVVDSLWVPEVSCPAPFLIRRVELEDGSIYLLRTRYYLRFWDHSSRKIPFSVIIAVCIAVIVTWPIMVLAARAGGHSEQSFVRDTISRLMGLIVVAMGVQFTLSGIQGFFDGTAAS